MAAKITKRERKSRKALERMLLGIPEHEQGSTKRSGQFYWADDETYRKRVYLEQLTTRGGTKKKGGKTKWERNMK